MKKLFYFTLFLAIIASTSFGQNTLLNLSGQVLDVATGVPIPDHIVMAEIASGGMVQTYTFSTNNNGFYGDSIPAFSQGDISVWTADCLGEIHMFSENFYPGNYNLVFDFYICNDSIPGDCEAYYTYEFAPSGNLTVLFTDQSTGNPTNWLWDFGDGSTSTEQNPIHYYNGYSLFTVCLTIWDDDSTCYDNYCEDIIIGTFPDCENWIWYEQFGNTTFEFHGEAFPETDLYYWDFGDSVTASGQVAEHTYDPNMGNFFVVSLVTYHFDPMLGDSCVAESVQEITIGGTGDCENWFEFQQTPDLTFTFSGFSFPETDTYFWDFGDGNTGSGQTVTHVYENPNVTEVVVILTTIHTIPGTVDTCVAITEQVIFLGGQGDCENWFDYEQVGDASFVFYGESYPETDLYYWDFGDGSTDFGQMVDHTFDPNMSNVFEVILTTYHFDPAVGDSCVAESVQEIWLGGNVECENWFVFEQIEDATYIFVGDANPPTNYYLWVFGDGTTGFGQTIEHTFDPALGQEFLVCLTTIAYTPVMDSCIAESCEAVELNGQSGIELAGTIFTENEPADFALVGLFGMDPNGGFTYDFVPTEPETGFYIFENVPVGDYYIFASLTPQSQHFYDYFPTYYGDVTFWSEATLITLGQPNNPYDINLIPFNNMTTGPASITGTVTMANKSILEESVTVQLMDNYDNILIYDQTNEQGEFSFELLPFGLYKLKVEIPGVNSDIAFVELTQNSQSANINFIVSGDIAYLSVSDIYQFISSVGEVYPNPLSNELNLTLTLKEQTNFQIGVVNHLGQMLENNRLELNEGKQTIQFDVSVLAEGIYNLMLLHESGGIISKKFIISR